MPIGGAPDSPVAAGTHDSRSPSPLGRLEYPVVTLKLAEQNIGADNHRIRKSGHGQIPTAVGPVVMVETELRAQLSDQALKLGLVH